MKTSLPSSRSTSPASAEALARNTPPRAHAKEGARRAGIGLLNPTALFFLLAGLALECSGCAVFYFGHNEPGVLISNTGKTIELQYKLASAISGSTTVTGHDQERDETFRGRCYWSFHGAHDTPGTLMLQGDKGTTINGTLILHPTLLHVAGTVVGDGTAMDNHGNAYTVRLTIGGGKK